MTVNQISIFLENKYGKLSEILALLAEEKIRIIAATVADTSEYGYSSYGSPSDITNSPGSRLER